MPGQMQSALSDLLSGAGKVSHKTLKFPKAGDAASAFKSEIESVYRALGGVLPSIPLNLRPWDIEFDGVAVELDEYLHFNRYRAVTLKSAGYVQLRCFPLSAYRRFCSEHEDVCLKNGSYGKKWSSESCEKQFGKASRPECLSGNGSPRWKQRAFYDFVKDLSPLLIGVRVVRISVWDELVTADGAKEVGEVLDALVRQSTPSASHVATGLAFAALVGERTGT